MKEKKTVLALGFFDGVHLGHGALLRACRALSKQLGALAGAVTFETHPDALLSGRAPSLINTADDRRKIMMEQYHMDTVLTLPFDRAMMELPWQDFFRLLVERYGAAGLVCGEDFRFGFHGEGDAQKLRTMCQENGLPCRIIPQQTLHGIVVSSTYIRTLLERGQMEQAGEFLGHPHFLTGVVEPGRQLGRKLGFPTANIPIAPEVVCPRHGVYACKAWMEGRDYIAVTNVGSRPTVQGHQVRTESWIQGFEGDLYGKTITLEFHSFLRPERKFDSVEELRQAVLENAAQARQYFRQP